MNRRKSLLWQSGGLPGPTAAAETDRITQTCETFRSMPGGYVSDSDDQKRFDALLHDIPEKAVYLPDRLEELSAKTGLHCGVSCPRCSKMLLGTWARCSTARFDQAFRGVRISFYRPLRNEGAERWWTQPGIAPAGGA